ncbi:DUF6801 domain-containing protein [Fodinicola feengrottensis]|uniref:DUF6801 domain-containing protein n=1 Tax=Fodinicola feengrottensis TaxID=435914 RepID=UPI0028BD8B78|nr:DUF6801 domain-containing protein [Fodinicola feengrottensis]
MRGRWRQAGRRSIVWIGAGVLAIAAGLTGGSSSATAQQNADVPVPFTCHFPSGTQPSGTQPVAARVAVTLPGAGAVGQPIQPSGIRLSLTVPAATGIASGSTARERAVDSGASDRGDRGSYDLDFPGHPHDNGRAAGDRRVGAAQW